MVDDKLCLICKEAGKKKGISYKHFAKHKKNGWTLEKYNKYFKRDKEAKLVPSHSDQVKINNEKRSIKDKTRYFKKGDKDFLENRCILDKLLIIATICPLSLPSLARLSGISYNTMIEYKRKYKDFFIKFYYPDSKRPIYLTNIDFLLNAVIKEIEYIKNYDAGPTHKKIQNKDHIEEISVSEVVKDHSFGKRYVKRNLELQVKWDTGIVGEKRGREYVYYLENPQKMKRFCKRLSQNIIATNTGRIDFLVSTKKSQIKHIYGQYFDYIFEGGETWKQRIIEYFRG